MREVAFCISDKRTKTLGFWCYCEFEMFLCENEGVIIRILHIFVAEKSLRVV